MNTTQTLLYSVQLVSGDGRVALLLADICLFNSYGLWVNNTFCLQLVFALFDRIYSSEILCFVRTKQDNFLFKMSVFALAQNCTIGATVVDRVYLNSTNPGCVPLLSVFLQAQQSLELIQDILKEAGQDNLLENSSLTSTVRQCNRNTMYIVIVSFWQCG